MKVSLNDCRTVNSIKNQLRFSRCARYMLKPHFIDETHFKGRDVLLMNVLTKLKFFEKPPVR